MKALRFIIDIFRKYPWLCLANVFAAIMMTLLGVLSLFSLTPIIDLMLNQNGQGFSSLSLKVVGILKALGISTSFPGLIGFFIALVLATTLAQIFGSMLIMRTKFLVLKDLMMGVLKDIFSARWLFFITSEQGKIYNTLSRELASVGDGFIAIGTLFSNGVQILVLLVVPFYISWKVSLLCLGAGGVAAACFLFFSRSSYHWGRKSTATANVMTGMIYENISSAKLVLGHGNGERLVNNFYRAYDAHLASAMRFLALSYTITTSYRPVGVLVAAIALFSSRWLAVPISEVAVLLLAFLQVSNLIGNLIAQKNLISNIVPGYEQIEELRGLAHSMKQKLGPRTFQGLKKEIIFEGVSFFYPGRDVVLHDINFRVYKGESVAFVGRSGSGKTTLLDIFMGLHDPAVGRVLLDGIPLAEYDVNSYRRTLGYVPQENVLFNLSIKDNLLWGNPDAADEEIAAACRLVYADEFIVDLPHGYDTIVGDRGVRLSGGQIQRLALARAFLRKPELLILDEATSALDSHSERVIQKALENIARSTTMIVVAHRLSTIKRAARIYVLEKGRIIEEGSYEELMHRGGIFSSMAQLQELGVIKK